MRTFFHDRQVLLIVRKYKARYRLPSTNLIIEVLIDNNFFAGTTREKYGLGKIVMRLQTKKLKNYVCIFFLCLRCYGVFFFQFQTSFKQISFSNLNLKAWVLLNSLCKIKFSDVIDL